jgi:hypothetical protein
MSNEKREQQMMDAADMYADEVCDESCTGAHVAETINDFCAGWRAADSHPNWISVEDELPPIAYHDDLSENYLVVDSDGELLIAYYDAKNKLWFSVDSNPKIYDVTHWMPIVPPRKED